MLAGTAWLAKRVDIAPAILLLLAGIVLAFVPGMPAMELQPELVLLVVLPPLIYSASVAMSWREFKHNLRPIVLLAVGCVIFTAAMVAAATHYLIGLPWNVGFLLGAIVSPPDAVAPIAIARRLGIPRRVLVVLEGEGLANDATALILYRFAVDRDHDRLVLAVEGDRHIFRDRRLRGAFGIARRLALAARPPLRARPADRDHAVPDHALYRLLGAGASRRQRRDLNGCLRALRELERSAVDFGGDAPARHLLLELADPPDRGPAVPADRLPDAAALREIEGVSARRHPDARSALVAIIVIVARFAWTYPATYLPRVLSKSLRKRDPSPPWQHGVHPVLCRRARRGVAGRRAGAAAALANGDAFPDRDLVLFAAFGVIFVTLVGIGFSLPMVVRWLGVADAGRHELVAEHQSEIAARREALDVALRSLDAMIDKRELPDEVVSLLAGTP